MTSDALSAPAAEQPAAVFPLLDQPATYVPCQMDLTKDEKQRAYWIELFRNHLEGALELAMADALDRGVPLEVAESQEANARAGFTAYLNQVEAEPDIFGKLTILRICEARESCLRRANIPDPYRLAKQKENETAMSLLPAVLAEIDAISDEPERIERVMRGVFAGNIFDMGAVSTLEMFRDGQMDFHVTLNKLKDRPWFVDHLDAWQDRWINGPKHNCAVVFVDNAGPDVLLGMVPLVRELLRKGTGVILTANATPTLNDVTHDELTKLVHQIAAFDRIIGDALSNGELELITSGNRFPLIDLRRINPDLADAIYRRDVDLCIIEGMGRAIETNFDAEFTCDTLKLAMIKDLGVGEAMGATLYDLVMRFDPE